jgi:cytochrome c-type biogenesis protein
MAKSNEPDRDAAALGRRRSGAAMPFALKALGATLAVGVAVTSVFAWQRVRSTSREPVAGDVPCSAATEACGAHSLKRGRGAAQRIEGRPRLLVFTSHSCPACKRMDPVVEAALTACDGAHDIERVDFDDDAGDALAATYNVTLLPAFVSIDATGSEVARLTGVQPQEQLERAIEEVRGIRCVSVERVPDKEPM